MRSTTIVCGILICISLNLAKAVAQNAAEVASRMRPLGSPSAVDRYQQPQRNQPTGSLRQVAWMQSSDSSPMTMPSLGPSTAGTGAPLPGFALPSNVGSPAPRTNVVAPQTNGALPVNPNVNSSPLSSSPLSSAPTTRVVPNQGPSAPAAPAAPRTMATNDYAPIAQPRLDGFATVDNCRNVTGPSSYRAAGFFNCDPGMTGGPTYTIPATYTPPPAQIAPVSTLPPAVAYPAAAPVSITGTLPPVLPGSAGYRPLFSFGQENNPVQVGQGLIGQPVAYVPGQTFRNVLRYLAP